MSESTAKKTKVHRDLVLAHECLRCSITQHRPDELTTRWRTRCPHIVPGSAIPIQVRASHSIIKTPMPVLRRIISFHQDDQGHWVAELECGHTQHVRHDPPWTLREWVLTQGGRASHLNRELPCKKCE